MITYRQGNHLDLDQVIALYRASTLGARRPVDDRARMAAMLQNANIVVTAWDGEHLVGISRALTDFVYATYLSDSLEVVRQLFQENVIQSGYWHRFAMTAHSPVGKNPERYGVVKVGPEPGLFADNDLWHEDPQCCDHELFGAGLAKALYNYMHGIGLDEPLSFWFDFRVPPPLAAPPPDFPSRGRARKTR